MNELVSKFIEIKQGGSKYLLNVNRVASVEVKESAIRIVEKGPMDQHGVDHVTHYGSPKDADFAYQNLKRQLNPATMLEPKLSAAVEVEGTGDLPTLESMGMEEVQPDDHSRI